MAPGFLTGQIIPYITVPAGQGTLKIVASAISAYNYDAGQTASPLDVALYANPGSAPTSGTWQYGAGALQGYTLTIGNPPAGTYYLLVGSAYSTPNPAIQVLSFTVTATILPPPPVITAQPQSRTAGVGGSASFSVSATGQSLQYQWQKGGNNIAGANGATYSLNNIQSGDAGAYRVVVSNSGGSVTSSDATLTVQVAPTITTQPHSQTIQAGQSATFNVVATGTPTPTYQWKNNSGNISGATASTYTISGATTNDTGSYTVVVSNPQGNVTSSPATLTVQVPPAIIAQPQGATKTVGQSVTFSVAATGVPAPTYQWVKGNSNVPGATSSSYTIGSVTLSDAAGYSVVVSNPQGSVNSSTAILTVISPPSAPVISIPPQSQTVTAGQNVTFSVTAAGNPQPNYQWSKNTVNISGATSNSLTIASAATNDAGSYTVFVSNSQGSITSSGATLTVTPQPFITQQPVSQLSRPGQNITFSVTAFGVLPLNYQWRKGGANIAGASLGTLGLNNLTTNDAGNFDVVVANNFGSVTSSVAVLTVNAVGPTNDLFSDRIPVSGVNISVTGSNTGATKEPGEPVIAGNSGGKSVWWTWTAPANGSVTIDTIGSGFDTLLGIYTSNVVSSLKLVASDDESGGNHTSRVTFNAAYQTNYQIAVDGYNGDSGNIMLNIHLAITNPVITTQPAGQWDIGYGSNLTMNVAATGTQPLFYQWQKDGVNLSRANSNVLTVFNIQQSDLGIYNVIVSNVAGSVTSSPVRMVVPPDFVWASSVGGNRGVYGVALDGSGNVYVTGSFEGTATFGTNSLPSLGGQDIFLAKYDPAGNVLWARSAGGSGLDSSSGVAVDGNGNAYMTGFFTGTATFGSNSVSSAGNSDIFLTKYDAAGNVLWVRSGGGTSGDASYGVAVDSSGNAVYVTGAFQGTAIFGTISVTNAGGAGYGYTDVFVAKYDSSGNVLSLRHAGGNNITAYGKGIAADGSGNVYVTGYISGNGTTTFATFGTNSVTITGGSAFFLTKYDPTGNVQWVWRSADNGSGSGLALDGTGNVLLTGNGGSGLFLAKYDPAGNILWTRTAVSSNGGVSGAGVGIDAIGNIYLTGYYYGPTTFDANILANPNGSSASFLAKYDSAGNVLWARNAIGSSTMLAVTVDRSGNAFLAGQNNNNILLERINGEPLITNTPQSQAVIPGQNAAFNVGATGILPVQYQWRFNGTNLLAANSSSLYITNVQTTNTGSYQVIVSNLYGSSISATAILSLDLCTPPPPGLIGWWQGEGNAADSAGTNNGVLLNGVTSVNGVVGSAFHFDGTNAAVSISNAPSPQAFSIEAWVKFDSLDSSASWPGLQYLVFRQNSRTYNFEGFALDKSRDDSGGGGDRLSFEMTSVEGYNTKIVSTNYVTTNVFYHVVGTFDGTGMYLYVNGVLQSSGYHPYPVDYGTSPMFFGSSGTSVWDGHLAGAVDEVSLYDSALSASQVAAIYAAGSYGKCPLFSTALGNFGMVPGLAGGQSSANYYKITVPPGTASLAISIWGGTGDCDLYVRQGTLPTLNSYGYRPYIAGNNETVWIRNPAPGDWYLMLHGYNKYANVSLLARYGQVGQTTPSLAVGATSNSMNILWPSSGAAYLLEFTTNLSAPNSWQPWSGSPTDDGTQRSTTISNSFAAPNQFFRLRLP